MYPPTHNLTHAPTHVRVDDIITDKLAHILTHPRTHPRVGGLTSDHLAHVLARMQMDDIITEALENDNLQLQNMSGQKYVQTNNMFLDAVAKWQKNLGTVDSVLSCWQDVQKKWQVGLLSVRFLRRHVCV
jgi:hypothetical protein